VIMTEWNDLDLSLCTVPQFSVTAVVAYLSSGMSSDDEVQLGIAE